MVIKKQSQRGQSIVEYILVTGFVVLVSVSIFKVFRADLTEAYERAGQALIQGVNESFPEPSQPND